MNDDLPRAPAVARNRDAILAVLSDELRGCSRVLEIGSGTGEHAVWFAPALDWLAWQPSDRADNLPGINAWVDAVPAPNLRRAVELDVNEPPDLADTFDAAFSANTAHIMGIDEVRRMFEFVADLLVAPRKFCLYGPFNRNGAFTSASNARFDASLRSQDPVMGIRDLEELDAFAAAGGLERRALHPMPANNFIAVWSGENAAA